jgi:hypothetical protein
MGCGRLDEDECMIVAVCELSERALTKLELESAIH